MRIGQGFDIHKLVVGRQLLLGGCHIPHSHGLLGHSDGDCLLHAIIDSLLGAAALGDIGIYFPPTDESCKDANSLHLLAKVGELLAKSGFKIINIDSTIICESPKLASFYPEMRSNISHALGISFEQINVKAKTMEGLGEIGSKRAIAAQAIALIA